MATPIFDQVHPKISEITFNFPEFAPAFKKSVYSIDTFLRYSQFWSPVTRLATSISDDNQTPKNFWSTFNSCEFVSTCKKRLFNDFVLEIWLIKKSCNLIGWEHFRPYLKNQNFLKYEICAGTQEIIWIYIIAQIQ